MSVKPTIHGRDHCPGGSDPIPCLDTPTALGDVPWARIYQIQSPIQSIPNNATQTITFSLETNNYTSHFTTDLAAEQIGVVNKGYYGIRFGLDWGLNNNESVIVELRTTGAAGHYSAHFPYTRGAVTMPNGEAVQTVNYAVRLPAGGLVQLFVHHDIGASRDIVAAYLEVYYLGTFTGSGSALANEWS